MTASKARNLYQGWAGWGGRGLSIEFNQPAAGGVAAPAAQPGQKRARDGEGERSRLIWLYVVVNACRSGGGRQGRGLPEQTAQGVGAYLPVLRPAQRVCSSADSQRPQQLEFEPDCPCRFCRGPRPVACRPLCCTPHLCTPVPGRAAAAYCMLDPPTRQPASLPACLPPRALRASCSRPLPRRGEKGRAKHTGPLPPSPSLPACAPVRRLLTLRLPDRSPRGFPQQP